MDQETSVTSEPSSLTVDEARERKRQKKLYSKGMSGKKTLKSLKENPFTDFTVRTAVDTWFGSMTEPVLKLALFLCNGYIWEARNSDRFHAHHSELHRVEQCRDHLAMLLSDDWNKNFWPQQEEMEQLALIDFVRLLPYMWD